MRPNIVFVSPVIFEQLKDAVAEPPETKRTEEPWEIAAATLARMKSAHENWSTYWCDHEEVKSLRRGEMGDIPTDRHDLAFFIAEYGWAAQGEAFNNGFLAGYAAAMMDVRNGRHDKVAESKGGNYL